MVDRRTGSCVWRRFFLAAAGTAGLVTFVVYLFVVTIDPWDALPLSPSLPRKPVTTAARYALPMLARSPQFDSAVIGTSTMIQLNPDRLDHLFGAHFVNLAILKATSYEQVRLLQVFLHAHPSPRFVMIGLDVRWCDPQPQPQYTDYEFPEWLYEQVRWNGYLRMFNLFAVQEAGRQLWAILGLKQARHGIEDSFAYAEADQRYDAVRAHEMIVAQGTVQGPADPTAQVERFAYTTYHRLELALAAIPESTRKLLVFVPFVLAYQGPTESPTRAYWAECKRRISSLARNHPNTVVADFMIPSPITADETNYFDVVHYRPKIADQMAADLARASAGLPSTDGDYRLLTP
jgi:hypothetical protein